MAVDVAPSVAAAFEAAALQIGGRLVDEAVWHDDRCTWLGDDVGDEGEVVHRSLGPDLYGGTSGIGWFLAHLAALTGDDRLGATARGALRHALSRTHAPMDAGLYTGSAGVALAAVAGGRALGAEELVQEGAGLARRAAEQTAVETESEVDLIGGLAGTILALLELARAFGDERLLDAAQALGVRLRDRGEQRTEPTQPRLCGLGHGASGVALALLELDGVVGDRRFGDAAASELDYERSWFSREHGNWPDLRELDSRVAAGDGPSYPVFWCHGAAGIGLVRLQAYERTGDVTCLAEAAAAVDAASATMLRLLASPDVPAAGSDLSLCHGVGSVAELHLAAARVTGDDEHVTHARRLVRLAIVGGDADVELRLPDELPCGIPGGGETAGLMVGLAGIGALLLRLSDPGTIPSPAWVAGWAA